MRLLRRKGPLADVLGRLDLARGERVLAHAAAGPSHVVATNRALLLPSADGWRRVAWHAVTRAKWDDEAETLRVEEYGATGPVRHVVALDAPGHIPATVRERVTASIAVSRHVPLVGRTGVRVVGRRVPGEPELRWQLVFDAGLDMEDAWLRARADEALAEVRRETSA